MNMKNKLIFQAIFPIKYRNNIFKISNILHNNYNKIYKNITIINKKYLNGNLLMLEM